MRKHPPAMPAMLDAWITGHPGGCGAVHGEDSRRALERLSELAREGAGGVVQHRMVAQAVHYLIVIKGHGARRKVTEFVQIVGNEGGSSCSNRFLLEARADEADIRHSITSIGTPGP